MAGFPKGHFKHTEESKLKIGLGNKGKIVSDETRKKLSMALLGRPSLTKGRKHSEEAKIKIREARKKQTFSIETRQKMREAHSGNKSPFWRGGVSVKNKSERQIMMERFEYRSWRKDVFKRDNYTCVECGDSCGGNLEAHHIKGWIDFPDLRLDVSNGITLCKECHKKTDNYGRKNWNKNL